MVEDDLVLVPVAMLAVGPDAAAAEPRGAVAENHAELDAPKGAVPQISAEVVASMVVDEESVSVVAVPMRPGAYVALVGLEIVPRLVAFSANLAVHEGVPRMAETVFALEAESRMAEH